jgi:hypothetical protein
MIYSNSDMSLSGLHFHTRTIDLKEYFNFTRPNTNISITSKLTDIYTSVIGCYFMTLTCVQ